MKVALCWLFRHKLFVVKHIKGNHTRLTWVALLGCERCNRRYVMLDEHQALLRYDNDVDFAADLLTIYPQVSDMDLLR